MLNSCTMGTMLLSVFLGSLACIQPRIHDDPKKYAPAKEGGVPQESTKNSSGQKNSTDQNGFQSQPNSQNTTPEKTQPNSQEKYKIY